MANPAATVTANTTQATETPLGRRRSLAEAAANNSSASGAVALASAHCQRECTDAHDQHREQLTLGCSVIPAFAPTLKRCWSDE